MEALAELREWYPTQGKVYVIKRRRTRTGRLIIDCKRMVDVERLLPIGRTVAAALGREFREDQDGFVATSRELPDLFTQYLSRDVFGQPGRLYVEMM
jgi:hypothetical protein